MTPIRIIPTPASEPLPCGASRFWGNPDLPEGTAYPMYIDDDGDEYPYFFICQINCADIAAYDVDNLLPHEGLLLFFAKIDHYLGEFAATDCVGGVISEPDAVKVLYYPNCDDMREVVLIGDDDEQLAPQEMQIKFSLDFPDLCDDHALLAAPTHREWEAWDHPYEKWEILLQIDSFSGADFDLNFMDCGVLDFLISPRALRAKDFTDVRAIVLST